MRDVQGRTVHVPLLHWQPVTRIGAHNVGETDGHEAADAARQALGIVPGRRLLQRERGRRADRAGATAPQPCGGGAREAGRAWRQRGGCEGCGGLGTGPRLTPVWAPYLPANRAASRQTPTDARQRLCRADPRERLGSGTALAWQGDCLAMLRAICQACAWPSMSPRHPRRRDCPHRPKTRSRR